MKGRIAWNLLKKSLGFRYLMDVIPIQAGMVKGSHGRMPSSPEAGPVFLSSVKARARARVEATDVKAILLETLAALRA